MSPGGIVEDGADRDRFAEPVAAANLVARGVS